MNFGTIPSNCPLILKYLAQFGVGGEFSGTG